MQRANDLVTKAGGFTSAEDSQGWDDITKPQSDRSAGLPGIILSLAHLACTKLGRCARWSRIHFSMGISVLLRFHSRPIDR